MSIDSVMSSNHLVLCHPLLLLPSIFPSIRVFSSELALGIRWPKYWSFSFSISLSDEYSGLISFRIDHPIYTMINIFPILFQLSHPFFFSLECRGEGNGNPLQYSRLENPMDRGSWQATVHGVSKSWTWLSDFTSLHFILKQIHHISSINSSVCIINS